MLVEQDEPKGARQSSTRDLLHDCAADQRRGEATVAAQRRAFERHGSRPDGDTPG
jgi:hypothetical protein